METGEARLFGHATISPGTARAGDVGRWELVYRIGEKRLQEGDAVIVWSDSDTDWEEPQTVDPNRSGFAQVAVPDGVSVAARVLGVKKLEVKVLKGSIGPGGELRIAFGEGTGTRMQTFSEAKRYFHLRRLDADGTAVAVPDSPFLRVLGGPAVQLVVLNPSSARPGSQINILVKAQDQWGNPASEFNEPVTVRLAGQESSVEFPRSEAVAHLTMTVPEHPGFYRVTAECQSFKTEGNPLRCVEGMGRSIFWGDLHGGQVADAEKIDAFYAYAKDVSQLDFCSYQRNDHETTDRDWKIQQEAEEKYHLPGEFVSLPGYEWSADTCLGGDRNVLFPRYGMPLLRSSHSGLADESYVDKTELVDRSALFQHYRLSEALLIPHVGGRTADISLHEPNLEPVLEIASTHGTFEWFYQESLRRGYTMGVVAGSDGYTGRPGGEYPGFIARRFSRSGATAVLADDLSLDSILDAVRSRRCYATSGARIYLDIRANGAAMGAIHSTTAPVVVNITVAGTDSIEKIDVFRRDRLIHSFTPEGGRHSGRWRVVMDGAAAWRSYSGVRWVGRMATDGGVFSEVRPLRLDSPRSKVTGTGTREVSWDTTNCGYAHGFEFTGPGPGAGFELSVSSYLCTGMYSGAEIPGTMKIAWAPAEEAYMKGILDAEADGHLDQATTVPLGLMERSVTIEPVLEGRPREVSFTFTDADPVAGFNPYWIRVTQRDMHCAWSSPVFIRYAG